MSVVFHKLCENLSSSMDRNELYQIAKQLGLPVTSTMKKDEFCAALSTYALSLRQIFGRIVGSG
ncbi:MAG: Rho termination factor N-terminal domain-containing protein, partial [Candidatus Paceibacterota bacterium]